MAPCGHAWCQLGFNLLGAVKGANENGKIVHVIQESVAPESNLLFLRQSSPPSSPIE